MEVEMAEAPPLIEEEDGYFLMTSTSTEEPMSQENQQSNTLFILGIVIPAVLIALAIVMNLICGILPAFRRKLRIPVCTLISLTCVFNLIFCCVRPLWFVVSPGTNNWPYGLGACRFMITYGYLFCYIRGFLLAFLCLIALADLVSGPLVSRQRTGLILSCFVACCYFVVTAIAINWVLIMKVEVLEVLTSRMSGKSYQVCLAIMDQDVQRALGYVLLAVAFAVPGFVSIIMAVLYGILLVIRPEYMLMSTEPASAEEVMLKEEGESSDLTGRDRKFNHLPALLVMIPCFLILQMPLSILVAIMTDYQYDSMEFAVAYHVLWILGDFEMFLMPLLVIFLYKPYRDLLFSCFSKCFSKCHSLMPRK